MPRLLYIVRLITTSLVVAGMALSSYAATNVATDPGGGVTILNSSNVITINSLELAIVKNARHLDGTLLADSAVVPAGTKIYFVIYIDNPTDTDVTDISIFDTVVLGPGGFAVVDNTFEILNEAGPGIDMNAANDTAWAGTSSWNSLNWSPQTDTGSDDYLDWNVTTPDTLTVGSAGAVANRQLDVPISGDVDKLVNPRRVAVRFQVTMNP